jgi:hypothetical protein
MPKGWWGSAQKEQLGLKFARFVSVSLLAVATAFVASPVFANTVLKQSAKMRADGMRQWRNGDFLGAFGNCYGARQLAASIKDANSEQIAEALGYSELCIGLALQQMKVKGGQHDFCKAFIASQKHFALVDAGRKQRGEKLADGGYMAETIKESRCKK